jgi:hypothetical protein
VEPAESTARKVSNSLKLCQFVRIL